MTRELEGSPDAPRELRPLDGIPLATPAPVLGSRQDRVGDAEVFAATLDAGHALGAGVVDVFVLPMDALPRARRLVTLGNKRVGGFIAGGETAEGRIAILRKRPKTSLAALASSQRVSPERALAVGLALAEALATLEDVSLFGGPLRPADVALDEEAEGGPFIVAEPLVRALLGETSERTGNTAPSPRWTPPEQAEGAPWDAAANRYVLGLVLYRLIAGEHPFSGVGLRDVHDSREAPPFEEKLAATLQPGVMSFVLSLLKGEPNSRPRSAKAIAEGIAKLRGASTKASTSTSTKASTKASTSTSTSTKASTSTSTSTSGAPKLSAKPVVWSPRRTTVAIAIAAASVGIAVIASLASTTKAEPTAPITLATRDPLTSRSAEACAPCHAKQVEEWKRSVMAFASKSPLYRSLESAVEEQVGRDDRCPNGAGILRKRGPNACVDETTGQPVTGSGGEHWCVHCHAPLDQLASRVPAWSATDVASDARRPLGDLLSKEGLEGITCVACHATVGPVDAHSRNARRGGIGGGAYEGNPTWTSSRTGATFSMRPEDARGVLGIGNSGYRMEPRSFFVGAIQPTGPTVHAPMDKAQSTYLKSSEFCGSCHDVRLFGTDVLGVRDRGEHFKRLRNAFSEWRSWADTEARAGRTASSCQDCHMSQFPGVCESGAPRSDSRSDACPTGTGFVAKRPGTVGNGASHYFTGVEVPFASGFPEGHANDRTLDADGIPVGLRPRRDLLVKSAFKLDIEPSRVSSGVLEIPVVLTNVGAGHRVPAGFSQEREFWVELRVSDARGNTVYEVGRIDRPDQDLKDKIFLRINTDDRNRDGRGRPLGVFGADIADGPDVPRWSPDPVRGGTQFRGQGLINFQNGFLRCVRCIGVIEGGVCLPGPGQGRTRADRFGDGDYDLDTGECRSNLFGGNELFETYFPVGALDADRGVLRAPDSIIDTRSAPPNVPLRYTYVLSNTGGRARPFKIEATLRFRAFPPFLIRAFASYERERAARGERPSGPQMTEAMLDRLDVVDLVKVVREVP